MDNLELDLVNPEISQNLQTLAEEIKQFSTCFVNSFENILQKVSVFVNDHCNWIRLISPENTASTKRAKEVLLGLQSILTELRDKNSSDIENVLTLRLGSIQASLFSIIMSSRTEKTNSIPKYSENLIKKFKLHSFPSFNSNFNYLIRECKSEILKTTIWSSSSSLETSEFFEILSEQLHLFLPKGFHNLYKSELIKSLNIGQRVTWNDSDTLLTLHFESVSAVLTCLKKNTEYMRLSESLKTYSLSLESLAGFNIKSAACLILTNCPSGENIDKKFSLTSEAREKSPKHSLEHLTVIGSQSANSFNFDISVPSKQAKSSSLAYIFPFKSNFYLVDVSDSGLVKIKLDQELSHQLVDTFVLVLSRNHEFIVQLSESLIEGSLIKSLHLVPVPNCELTNCLQPIECRSSPEVQSSFLLGRDNACNVKVLHNEISKHHAVVFYEPVSAKWFIRDLSSNGSYFKLKRWTAEGLERASSPYLLRDSSVFTVDSSTFLFRKPSS